VALSEKCGDSGRIDARDTNAMFLQMRPPFDIRFQR
jgi:hypothetical protein